MPTYDDTTLEPIYPVLEAGQCLHIAIYHNEMSMATNEQCHCLWLTEGQQPLQKKGNRQSVHVSNLILKMDGWLQLTTREGQGFRHPWA